MKMFNYHGRFNTLSSLLLFIGSLCLLVATTRAAPTELTSPSDPSNNSTTCMTNAECIQKKLPLIKPPPASKRRSTLKPRQSPQPNQSFKLKITRTDGSTFGYVSAAPEARGYYSYTTSFDQAMIIRNPSTTPSDLEIQNPTKEHFDIYTWLGGHTGRFPDGYPQNPNPDFSTTSKNYAFLTAAPFRLPPGPATNDESLYNERGTTSLSGTSNTGETAIWSYDPNTMSLLATWINSDGTSVPSQFLYTGQSLAITGSAAEYALYCPSCGSFQVYIYLVDPNTPS